MANIKTTDIEVALFTGTDPYRYDVDNRPLRNLILNDIAINTELETLVTEVTNARTDNTVTPAVEYGSLDGRLEAISQANVDNASINYSLFEGLAELKRTTHQSGWVQEPKSRAIYPEGAATGVINNDIGLLTGTEWAGAYPYQIHIVTDYATAISPLTTYVNGWLVKLFNIQAGGATAVRNNVAIKLSAAAASGGTQDFIFLEVWNEEIPAATPLFWKYGSPQFAASTYGEGIPSLDNNYTTDPLDPTVVHSITRLANGNFLQVRHRVRIVNNINPADDYTGFGGANALLALGRGAAVAPVASYSFTNMFTALNDAGLWRAGNGDSQSKTDLGTFDGYTYAIPIAMVHRRNTGDFTQSNQNGTKVVGNASTGYRSSGISGRPDNLYYDSIDRSDFIDKRHWVGVTSAEYERMLQRSLSEVLHGTTRLQWEQLAYDAGSLPVWGNRVLMDDVIFSDTIYPAYASDPTLGSYVNYVKDKSLGGTPFSKPDGVRRRFDAYPEAQKTDFVVNPFALTSDQTVAGFITITNTGGTTRLVTVDPTVLSGAAGNSVTADTPAWFWLSDSKRIDPVVGGTPQARTYTLDVGTRANTDRVLCSVEIMFPSKSGTKSLPRETVQQEFFDGVNPHKSFSSGTNSPYWVVRDTSNKIWVAEYFTSKISVWDEAADGSMTLDSAAGHSISSATIAGGVTNAFTYPTSVAVYGNPFAGAGSGAVWVVDHVGRKVKKYTFSAGVWTLAATIETFTCQAATRRFGSDSGVASVYAPYALAITSDGAKLYVVDSPRHVVYEFNTAALGTATIFAGVLDTPGTSTVAPIKLNYPTGISMDGTNVVITDVNNNRSSILDDNGIPITTFVNSETGGSSMPANITSGRYAILIGTPGSADIKYLVTAGGGGTSDRPNTLFKVDKDFNIEYAFCPYAPTSIPNMLGGIAVDSQTSPNYVWITNDTQIPITPNGGGWVLNYSNLSVKFDRATSGFGNTFSFSDIQYVPASGSAPARIFASRRPVGGGVSQTALYSINGDGSVVFSSLTALPSGVTTSAFTSYSQKRNIAGVHRFYESIVADGYVQKIYRWIASGSNWVRDASPSITLSPGDSLYGVSLGLDQDTSGNLYLTFSGVTGLGGASNVVHRYKWDGANFVAPGGAGNTSGVFGTDGVTGGTSTTLATPWGISVSEDGTALFVVGKTTAGWSGGDDGGRFVPLGTTDAKWLTGSTPYLEDVDYLTDSANRPSTVSTPIPGGVFALVSGQDMYILTSNHKLLHYRMSILNNTDSYQLAGEFGIYNESGTDHARLTSPLCMIMSTVSADRMIIADTGSNRLLSIHKKMAGVSSSSGNISTLTSLVDTERLKLWTITSPYQGIGRQVFTAGDIERVWSTQIVSASEFMYVTSLGRSPVQAVSQLGSLAISPAAAGGAIDRLPLGGKANGYDSYSFGADPLQLSNINEAYLSSSILKIPVATYSLTAYKPFRDDAGEDSLLVLARYDASVTQFYTTRGISTWWGAGQGTFYSSSTPLAVAKNRVVFIPYLIRRRGRVFLMIVTSIATGVANVLGNVNEAPISAMDIYDVPGRILLR